MAKAKKINDDFEAKTLEYTSKIDLLDKKHQELEKLESTTISQMWKSELLTLNF